MKRLVMLSAVLLLAGAITGCPAQKEQQQSPQEQGFAPAPMITPDQIRHLEAAAARVPNNPAGWAALGNALFDMNRCFKREGPHQTAGCTEAAKAYQKALDLDPENVNVRVDRGTSLWAAGDFENALAEHRRAMKQDPGHLNARLNAGVTLVALNRPAEAIKELEEFLRRAPNAPNADHVRSLIADLKAGGARR